MVVELTYSPEADASLKSLAVEEVRKAGKETVKSDFSICKKYQYRELAGAIDVPVLLLGNRKDKMVPASLMEEFGSIVKGSTLKIYDAKGHLPYLENAAEVNSDIDVFLQNLK
jgi:pimeloyl-ACP methyl ester carboxylesterase